MFVAHFCPPGSGYGSRDPIESGSGSRAVGTVHVLVHVLMTSLPVCRRDGTSWGFSIVGGAEPGSERTEPVHVLFVVPESPAAKVQISSVADSVPFFDPGPGIGFFPDPGSWIPNPYF
jgi:hypothetical protein